MFEGYIMNGFKMVNDVVFVVLNLFKVQDMFLSSSAFIKKTNKTPKNPTLIQRLSL